MSSHPPDRPNVSTVLPLCRQLYDEHCTGCCMHIVLDDGNLETDNIQFCLDYARKEEHPLCIQIAALMLQMSPTQRRKIYRSYPYDRGPPNFVGQPFKVDVCEATFVPEEGRITVPLRCWFLTSADRIAFTYKIGGSE